MQRLLAAPDRPEAWFCADDVLSIGALSALADAGMRVPEDVGVIGLNDMEMAGWANIGLTTIHQPFAAMVAASVAMVTARIADPDRPSESRLFPCHIVERRTLRPLP
jgi:DNA-binding LacI/PurR family transcriptional regulator